MTASNDIAVELKSIRQMHAWSQEDLACELGISFSIPNHWGKGFGPQTDYLAQKSKNPSFCRTHIHQIRKQIY